MKKCRTCGQPIREGEFKILNGIHLCDDCYIDAVIPKMPKAHYDNDAEFMNRLKNSYTVRPQRYH